MTEITDWQLREIARELFTAVQAAAAPEEIPTDAWIDARLRTIGCSEDELRAHRDRIRKMPLRRLADGVA
jgi:hypothetical protein